ncbi:hypothetical protein H5410_040419 [Solanum commersonii]|uniref:Retrovirus-related Pol polyprotein from transposon TNT 1-94-like beta-barrel domain-containing protein n=1 Tax=Solanum commersonii TaxID=4109 RepID=A0A9J5XNV0_SOLCO|nr:hypothetical protein H5410_040419 [Solanum commersonii]
MVSEREYSANTGQGSTLSALGMSYSGSFSPTTSHAFMSNRQSPLAHFHPQVQQHPHFSPQQYQQLLHMLDQENEKAKANTKCDNLMASGMMHSANNNKWIIDSGASQHMNNSCNKVHLPTGALAHVTHIGSSQVLGGTEISNVWHIPAFHYNLLSVSKLTKELNCCVLFYPNFCVFQDLSSGTMRETDRLENDLYVVNADSQLISGDSLKSTQDLVYVANAVSSSQSYSFRYVSLASETRPAKNTAASCSSVSEFDPPADSSPDDRNDS